MPIVTSIYQDRAVVTFQESRHIYSVRVHGVEGKFWQPSVSGIISIKDKPQLIPWSVKQCCAYIEKKLPGISTDGVVLEKAVQSLIVEAIDCWKDDAMDAAHIGTLVHRFLWAELSFRAGRLPEAPERPTVNEILAPQYDTEMIAKANASIDEGLKFFNEHEIKPLLLERVLWSPTEGYIGTTDFIGMIDGELAIADYKTGKRLYSTFSMQLAAYANAYAEEFGTLPHVRWAINLKRDGGLEVEKRGLDTYNADLEAFRACRTIYGWDRDNDDWKKGSPIAVLGPLDALVARP